MWTNAGADGGCQASGDVHELSVHVCANGCDKPPPRRLYAHDHGGHHHVCVYACDAELHAYANANVGLGTR